MPSWLWIPGIVVGAVVAIFLFEALKMGAGALWEKYERRLADKGQFRKIEARLFGLKLFAGCFWLAAALRFAIVRHEAWVGIELVDELLIVLICAWLATMGVGLVCGALEYARERDEANKRPPMTPEDLTAFLVAAGLRTTGGVDSGSQEGPSPPA